MKEENSERNPSRLHQVKASFCGHYKNKKTASERRFLGFLVSRQGIRWENEYGKISTEDGYDIPDDVVAERTFEYSCPLIMAINVLSGRGSTMTIYLEGFSNIVLKMSNTEFKFSQEVNKPVVVFTYSGRCTRWGDMTQQEEHFATLTFRDKEQMGEFVVITTSVSEPEPETVAYRSRGRSSSGGSLLSLANGVMFGSLLRR